MLKKLLVALVASAFALGAYAQAPKSDTQGRHEGRNQGRQQGHQGREEAAKKKSEAKASKSKADAKDSRKDARKTRRTASNIGRATESPAPAGLFFVRQSLSDNPWEMSAHYGL